MRHRLQQQRAQTTHVFGRAVGIGPRDERRVAPLDLQNCRGDHCDEPEEEAAQNLVITPQLDLQRIEHERNQQLFQHRHEDQDRNAVTLSMLRQILIPAACRDDILVRRRSIPAH